VCQLLASPEGRDVKEMVKVITPDSKYDRIYEIPSLEEGVGCGEGRDMITHVRYLHRSLVKLTGCGIFERMGISASKTDEGLVVDDSNCDSDFIYNRVCQNDRYVLISHGTQDSPIYNFGNIACLNAFARSWENITAMPSRECVINKSQDEALRIELMKNVTELGFVDGEYRGYRVLGDGKFIKLTRCVVWNCFNDDDEYIGQAALFDRDESPVVDTTD